MELIWHTFAVEPPYGENILIWRGLEDSDGGFPLIGRRWAEPEEHITHKPDANGNFGIIYPEEYPKLRWAEIPVPKAALKKVTKWRTQRDERRRAV